MSKNRKKKEVDNNDPVAVAKENGKPIEDG